jgi:DNA-binding HxlR family transcriptional regulator
MPYTTELSSEEVGTCLCYTYCMVREAYKPDVLNGRCPSQQVLDMLADKWSVLVIACLGLETKRYSDLSREIGGISQKMLTQTLRSLEQNGLVARRVFPVVPPHVEYSLTTLGRSLNEPLKALCQWAQNHMVEVQAARASYQDSENRKSSDLVA